VGSGGGGRRFVEFFFDSQLKEVALAYSTTPDIYGSSARYIGLFITIEEEDLLLKSASDLYGALDFKYEDELLGPSKSHSSFYMECYIYEFEARSMRSAARRRGRRRTSAETIVLTRAFLSFPSWPSFLQHEARGKKARGDVAAYTSQPMPMV
jgi:hypothetical protein